MAYPPDTGGRLIMNFSAVIMLVVVGGVVWGGFICLLRFAMKHENHTTGSSADREKNNK